MDADAGFSVEDFSLEMGEYEVKKVRQFDRMWKVGPGGSVCEKMCVHDGKVYFGSANRNVYCLDATTGNEVWKFRTDGIILVSSPAISDGILFIGSYDRNMYALDARTGNLRWKFRTDGEIAAMPAVADGVVYFGSRDQNVYALDARTGNLRWKFRTQNEVVSAPAVWRGRIYIGSFDRNMYCIDTKTGGLLWKHETQGEIYCINGPLIVEGVVHFPSFDGNLRAVDAEDGRLAWKLMMGQYGLDEAPVYHEGHGRMYTGTRDGYYACISLDGKFVWKLRMSAVSDATVACFWKDRLYVGSGDYNLYCLTHDGREVWKYKANGPAWWYPAVHGDDVIFCSWDCCVYAVNAGTGKLSWKFACAGSPSALPPANDIFEFEMRIGGDGESEERKGYNLSLSGPDEEDSGAYKSRVTYRVSNQYAAKGKYQVDSDEEAF